MSHYTKHFSLQAIAIVAILFTITCRFSIKASAETHHSILDSSQWVVEDQSNRAVFKTIGDTLSVSSPQGITLWYKPRLTGNYTITYKICMPMNGDPNQRLSDLNCFWGANDPLHPENIFARSAFRNGIFPRYKTLTLYYVGYGGNNNTTTRFRRYYGGQPKDDDKVVRPIIGEYLDEAHLLKPNHWYSIRIKVSGKKTCFFVDGKKLFEYKWKEGNADGNFGFRMVKNHVLITQFKVK